MAQFGSREATSLARVACEVRLLACSVTVRYIQREYVRPGLPDFLPSLVQFVATYAGVFLFTNSAMYLCYDSYDDAFGPPNERN